MREYEGFGGNVLFLDSKRVIARTQYIEEKCEIENIRDASFVAPSFSKNGFISITTENNVIPIYFLPKQVDAMVEAFGIIDALVDGQKKESQLITGKQGRKLGMLRCSSPNHPFLRHSGKMNLYLLEHALRCEYLLVDQGCTIAFSSVREMCFLSSNDKVLTRFVVFEKPEVFIVEENPAPQKFRIIFEYGKKEYELTFEGKKSSVLGERIVETLFAYRYDIKQEQN